MSDGTEGRDVPAVGAADVGVERELLSVGHSAEGCLDLKLKEYVKGVVFWL